MDRHDNVSLAVESYPMRSFIFILAVCLAPAVLAQTETMPAYLKNPVLPDFILQLPDGKHYLTPAELDSSRPVMIMIFDPDCGHCHDQTKVLVQGMEQLGNLQIVMSAFQSKDKVQKFVDDFGLQAFPNIRVGYDGSYFFVPYFAVRNVPFMAIYGANRKLLEVFRGQATVTQIQELLQKGSGSMR